MFSYIKVLDICDQNITFSFNGDDKNFQDPPFRTIQGLAKLIDTIKDTAD